MALYTSGVADLVIPYIVHKTLEARDDLVVTLSADGDIPLYHSFAHFKQSYTETVIHIHQVPDGFPVVVCVNDLPYGLGKPLENQIRPGHIQHALISTTTRIQMMSAVSPIP